MERSRYDRRKRPDSPSERRNARHYKSQDRSRHHFTSNSQPYHESHDREFNDNFRGYQTPVQEYREPRTPDTPYIGPPRHASYDTPRPYAPPASEARRARFPREPSAEKPFKGMSGNISWQYDIPESNNQICEKYERPMDPKEFKEQCRRAYLQNAEDRKRNAELSVWGKCDWASYEKSDIPKHRR